MFVQKSKFGSVESELAAKPARVQVRCRLRRQAHLAEEKARGQRLCLLKTRSGFSADPCP
eukprot:SAG22_NODE_1337_length_4697_cov_2.318182_7_plen_60_part_00